MALYKYAGTPERRHAAYDLMRKVEGSFEVHPELSKVLSNPFVGQEDKRRLLIAAAAGDANDDYKSFIDLVISHKREMYARMMALAYQKIYRKANNISVVAITTAVDLGQKETDKLKDYVKKAFEGRTLEFTEVVNPDLIGGFRIDVDNNRIDASVAGELEQLRQKLISRN